MRIEISDLLFTHFAADPFGPLKGVRELAHDECHALRPELRRFLESLPENIVEQALHDPLFEIYRRSESPTGASDDVREWAAVRALNDEIPRRRIECFTAAGPRPPPYDLPELVDVPVDRDGLVPASWFRFDGSVFERNGRSFMMAPTTGSPNASHWFLQHAHTEGVLRSLSLRLDPFLHGPSSSFPRAFYRMIVYGRPLNWQRIATLRTDEHARWMADRSWSEYGVTETSWEPRDGEVHFRCEELPAEAHCRTRAGRYVHAIYAPRSNQIIHFDGALRIYTDKELASRAASHIRSAGKCGIRVKLFKFVEPLARDSLVNLLAGYYVWNDDLQAYFLGKINAAVDINVSE